MDKIFVDCRSTYCIELYCRTKFSRLKFSWVLQNPRNPQKILPSKILGYTVYYWKLQGIERETFNALLAQHQISQCLPVKKSQKYIIIIIIVSVVRVKDTF